MLYPQLTAPVMQLAEIRIRQYEQRFGRKLNTLEWNIFMEAYKGSRADVFMEMDVRKEEKEHREQPVTTTSYKFE